MAITSPSMPTSGKVRWIWAGIAFVAIPAIAATLGPLSIVGLPLASLAIGGIAAWWIGRTSPETTGQAAVIGVVAGIGALVGTIIAFALFGYVLGSDPAIQEFVRNSEPHPEARVPYEAIAPVAAATLAFPCLIGGLFNLGLATVGGLVVGFFVGRAQKPAA